MPWLLSIFSGIGGYVASALAAAALAAFLTHKIDDDALKAVQLADQKAAVQAVQAAGAAQKRQDDVALNAAVAEAKAQQKIITQVQTITKEITVHVPDTRVCIPIGLVRVLNAAAANNPDTSGIAPGQLDDACSTVTWRSLAGDIVDDYGTAHKNAEQLNALEGTIRDMVAAANHE